MKLEAKTRTSGGGAALRNEGRLPAIVYNKDLNMSVAIDAKAFDKVFREQGTSSLIELDVDGEEHQVVVREVQMNKRRRVPIHVDFFAITAGQKLEVAVPVVYEGTSVGQEEGGQLDIQRREVTILVLPKDIPHEFHVDLTELTIGDAIHIGDVATQFPETAELLDDEGLTLVTVLPPRLEEEEEPAEDEGAEPEVIGREDDEDEEGAPEASGDEDED